MAHELAAINGQTAICYFGETPWHKLGTKLDNPATAHEAMHAACLVYEVEKVPLYTANGDLVPNRQAVVRSDSSEVLGVVGKNYSPIQNAEAFEFLDNVVAHNGLRYHTAGALGKGERIWMLAKLPGEIRINGTDDVTEKFLLLSNTHDGSAALRVFFTPIRVVCQNTLTLAHQNGHGKGIRIPHRGDLSQKIQEAQKVLGLAQSFYNTMQEKVQRLARCYPNVDQLQTFFKSLYPDPQDIANNKRAANTRQELWRLFEEGKGQDNPVIRGSAWSALNAVSEFVDHHRSARGSNPIERANRQLESQWFGSGAKLKAKAWELILAIAN